MVNLLLYTQFHWKSSEAYNTQEMSRFPIIEHIVNKIWRSKFIPWSFQDKKLFTDILRPKEIENSNVSIDMNKVHVHYSYIAIFVIPP